MSRRHSVSLLTQIFALCFLPTLGLLTAGCEDDEKATSQVIFGEGALTRGPGTNCQDSAQMFTVGEYGTPGLKDKANSTPRKDGDSEGQGTVSVSCSVKASGSEFDVFARVNLTGPSGGLFQVDGKFKPTGTQENIHAIFSNRATSNTYETGDQGCTVTYDSTFQGVASGRVWGRIDCPVVSTSGDEFSCSASAVFRFENCDQ